MSEQHLIYWDANVFLSYLNNIPDRVPTVEAILEAIETSKTDRIVTSVLSKVEVAWVAHEKLNRSFSQSEEARIDGMWNNPQVVEMVDFNDEIALMARKIMREGMKSGWKLRTNDAIHLASAHWVGAVELQTYDLTDMQKFDQVLGLTICQPHIVQPKLFYQRLFCYEIGDKTIPKKSVWTKRLSPYHKA